MKAYPALWISLSLVLSSCASTVPNNPWNALTTETSPAATPLDCGTFPLPTESYPTHVVYDKASLNYLNVYRVCSEANESIAEAHVSQIDQLKIARKGLTEAGRAQRNIADMKQEMLDDERRHHFFQSIGYWVVIVGLGVSL